MRDSERIVGRAMLALSVFVPFELSVLTPLPATLRLSPRWRRSFLSRASALVNGRIGSSAHQPCLLGLVVSAICTRRRPVCEPRRARARRLAADVAFQAAHAARVQAQRLLEFAA